MEFEYWTIPTAVPANDPGFPLDPSYEIMSYDGMLQVAWTRDRQLLKEMLKPRWDPSGKIPNELVYFEQAPLKLIVPDQVFTTTDWLRPYFHPLRRGFLGFEFSSEHDRTHQFHLNDPAVLYGWVARMPEWFVIMLSLPLPILWRIRLWLARRKVRSGDCIRCGYDLRASQDRCPECGEKIVVVNRRPLTIRPAG